MRERHGSYRGQPLPFEPIERDMRWREKHKEGKSQWFFRCTALGSDGRCLIYSVRPDAPCKLYLPAEDPMCAMFYTPEGIVERYRQRKAGIKQSLHE